MKLANFKNTVINTNYGFDTENNVVVNRNTQKAIKWDDSGKIRLSVEGVRKRFSREEIVADVVVVAKKERKVSIAAQVRSIIAKQIIAGNTDVKAIRQEVIVWCRENTRIDHCNAWNYVRENFDKVAAEPAKFVL